jgi:hypothetical protein
MNLFMTVAPNGWRLSPFRCQTTERDRDPAKRDRTAALIIFNIHKTKQVHSDNFQFCTRPMSAMNFALRSFGQLELLVSQQPFIMYSLRAFYTGSL